ncbi:MAG: hypothetical protein ABI536_07860 [Gallionella sp.]
MLFNVSLAEADQVIKVLSHAHRSPQCLSVSNLLCVTRKSGICSLGSCL